MVPKPHINGNKVSVLLRPVRAEIAKLREERRRLLDGGIDDAVARRIVAIDERLRALDLKPE
jgi:hypothetical protein